MTVQTTYSQARANFVKIWDKVTQDREIVIIERRGADPVALVAADELNSILETAHLLRSPKNAERLLTALNRALRNEGQPQSLDELRAEVGLVDEA
jgi:antitoxin YefM